MTIIKLAFGALVLISSARERRIIDATAATDASIGDVANIVDVIDITDLFVTSDDNDKVFSLPQTESIGSSVTIWKMKVKTEKYAEQNKCEISYL